MYEYQQQLWETINNYVETCGGDTSNKTMSTNRMNAVVEVENIISKILAIDSEATLVKCSLCGKSWDAKTVHLHQGKYIGDECCWDERLHSSE